MRLHCSISDNDYINPQVKKKTRSSIDLDIYNFRRVPAAFHIFGYTSVVTTTDFKFYSEIYNRTKKQRRQKFHSFMVTIELKKKNSLTHNSENILIVFLSLSYKKVIQVLWKLSLLTFPFTGEQSLKGIKWVREW